MTILNKIIPFYSAIEEVIRAGRVVVESGQKRRNMRTAVEIKIELKERISKIEEREKEANHKRGIEILIKEKEAEDLIDQREHERSIEFEKHRVELFEKVKRLEVEIHQQIMAFDIDKQKEIRTWQREFIKGLEDESEQVLSERVPRMLAAAEPFKENELVYEGYIERILQVADKITGSIASDQEHFRDELKELAARPGKLTDSIIEMNKRLVFNSSTRKMIEEKN